MNLTDFTFHSFRILLLPFALLYGVVLWIRNKIYDRGVLHSVSFNIPVISVGNLSVGGTGKSPMIEYLIRHFKDNEQLAVISRGYKRKTKGYLLAGAQTTALEIGDEPMLFKQKFPDLAVAVGESRVEAIPQLLQDRPDTSLILLDDAFQHRAIRPGYSILLTDYNNLFTRDFLLPTGDLRDLRSSYRRADMLIVTKCPPELTESEANKIRKEIHPLPHQQVLFAALSYDDLYLLKNPDLKKPLLTEAGVLLVTGIANPTPLKQKLQEQKNGYEYLSFSDHHIFNIDDLTLIRQRYSKLTETNKLILTTEKDAVRLLKFRQELDDLPIYVIPVRHQLLFGGDAILAEVLDNYLSRFRQSKNSDIR
jgi:tetraacyldisaccharide 4'-kinase